MFSFRACTFAISLLVLLTIHIFGFVFCALVFMTKWWPLVVAYTLFVFATDSRCSRQGSCWLAWIQKLNVWTVLCGFYPVQLVRTAHLSPKSNYIFAYHPHNFISAGAFLNFATDGSGFRKLFPGIKSHLLIKKSMFHTPILRELYLACGMRLASQQTIKNICGGMGCGNIAVSVIGGSTGGNKLHLSDRKAFIRMALLTGAQLVPVYSFGESELLHHVPSTPSTLLSRVRRYCTLSFLFRLVLRTVSYDVGVLPIRSDIVTVVGSPIPVFKKKNPLRADVDRLYNIYTTRLKDLHERYKKPYLASTLCID